MVEYLSANEIRQLKNVDEYWWDYINESDPMPNITGGNGLPVTAPNKPLQRAIRIESKLDTLVQRPPIGDVTLSPEQYEDLKAALRADQDAYFMTKSGQVVQEAVEAALRNISGFKFVTDVPPPA